MLEGLRVWGFRVYGQGFGAYGFKGSCQNYGPLLGTVHIRCRMIIRTPKGTIILTTTHKA